MARSSGSALAVHPLTPNRWADFEALFGPRGAYGGCWCMWWRMTQTDYDRCKGEQNKQSMQAIVAAGDPPGLLAYAGEIAVGWCAIAPRENYSRFERTRVLKPVDDQPVWAITCFFVARGYRRTGVTRLLVEAAIDAVRGRGGKIVEAYPIEPRKEQAPDIYMYTGVACMFRALGFVEVARRSETRPIMRYEIG
jgi:GNAT superfamily N-acetyltransferase